MTCFRLVLIELYFLRLEHIHINIWECIRWKDEGNLNVFNKYWFNFKRFLGKRHFSVSINIPFSHEIWLRSLRWGIKYTRKPWMSVFVVFFWLASVSLFNGISIFLGNSMLKHSCTTEVLLFNWQLEEKGMYNFSMAICAKLNEKARVEFESFTTMTQYVMLATTLRALPFFLLILGVSLIKIELFGFESFLSGWRKRDVQRLDSSFLGCCLCNIMAKGFRFIYLAFRFSLAENLSLSSWVS